VIDSLASRAEGAPAGRTIGSDARSGLRPAADRMTDSQRLARIRSDLAGIESRDWTRVEDGEGGYVEATGEFGERVDLLRFRAVATAAEKQFVADALDTVRFLLGLIDRAIERMRAPPSSQAPAGPVADERKNYAAEAAMKCGEAAFKVFLGERHGLERPMTDERTAQKLRSILGVTSRRDLNSDDAAAARWKKLREEYAEWWRAER